jgi:pentatricopeptide repeat protein
MYHCQTLKLGLGTSEYVSGTLIDLYAKRGSLEESWMAFGETIHRSLIAWTTIISANTKHRNYNAVISLFNDMVSFGIAPDGVVLLSVLTACRYSGFISMGREIFDSMAAEHWRKPVAGALRVRRRHARPGGDAGRSRGAHAVDAIRAGDPLVCRTAPPIPPESSPARRSLAAHGS